MAKGTMQMASPDSPIYNGEFVISSPKSNPESKLLRQSLQTGTDGQEETHSPAPDLHNMPFDLGEEALKIAKQVALEDQLLSEEQTPEEKAEKKSSSEDEE